MEFLIKVKNLIKKFLNNQNNKQKIKFDSTDWGWTIMSIGMSIGAGIVFLPIQIGLAGFWVFLLSSAIGYPAVYLFQKLFINTLASAQQCTDYPEVISGYLGKNWGVVLGILYFMLLTIFICVYSTTITNDSASFIQTFGFTEKRLSEYPLYGLLLIIFLVSIASQGEKFLFKISTILVLTKLFVIAFLGFSMIPAWDIKNIGPIPSLISLIKDSVIMLPFTITSIIFLTSISPMVCSYREKENNIEIAKFRAMRTMKISILILFIVIFFYSISFTLGMGHAAAVEAAHQNISALAMVASMMTGEGAHSRIIQILSLVLNIFAVITAYFSIFLSFCEACKGILINFLERFIIFNKINKYYISKIIFIFAAIVSWTAVVINAPLLSFTSICSPFFGLIGCLIPAYLTYKIPKLYKYKGFTLNLIILVGLLLMVSPLIAFTTIF